MTTAEIIALCIGCCVGAFALELYHTLNPTHYTVTDLRQKIFTPEPGLPAVPSLAVVIGDDISEEDPASSVVFAIEEGLHKKALSIVCSITAVPGTGNRCVVITGFGSPKADYVMLLCDYLGNTIDMIEVDDAVYARVVRKSRLRK